MDELRSEGVNDGARTVIVRKRSWTRVLSMAALGLLLLVAVVIAIVWIERRPIATHFLASEFKSRGVTATYTLDRVGFRTQQVSNLVIGDPKRPDLTARLAQVQMRLKWDGNFEVYRIVARGVRLRGRLVNGRVELGPGRQIASRADHQETAVQAAQRRRRHRRCDDRAGDALRADRGRIQGKGRLSGGFKGRAAIASPRLVPGRCEALNLRTNLAVAVTARHPYAEGPVALDRFNCPSSHIDIVAPAI